MESCDQLVTKYDLISTNHSNTFNQCSNYITLNCIEEKEKKSYNMSSGKHVCVYKLLWIVDKQQIKEVHWTTLVGIAFKKLEMH